MKDLIAAWKDVAEVFHMLTQDRAREPDEIEKEQLRELRQAILQEQPLDKLEHRVGIIADLVSARGNVTTAQGADIRRLTQAIRALEKRCDELNEDAERRLHVLEFTLDDFFNERTRFGFGKVSALDRGPFLKLLEDTGQVLIRLPSRYPLFLRMEILFLDLFEFAEIGVDVIFLGFLFLPRTHDSQGYF